MHIVVVGAGVFGTWTAFHLQRAGARVTLVDAYGAGNSRSSSGGESRIIRCGYGPDEIYSRMARRSLVFWKELDAARATGPLRPSAALLHPWKPCRSCAGAFCCRLGKLEAALQRGARLVAMAADEVIIHHPDRLTVPLVRKDGVPKDADVLEGSGWEQDLLFPAAAAERWH